MKSDIENFKYLFHIEDGGGTGGKCISAQLIASNTELSKYQTHLVFCLILGKEKLICFCYKIMDLFSFLINLLNTRESVLLCLFEFV